MSKLPRRVLRVLEKCFDSEIQGMPAQFARGPHYTINGISVGSAVAFADSHGLIKQVDHKLGGWPPVLIRGFALTHQGRMTYCEWADRQCAKPAAFGPQSGDE